MIGFSILLNTKLGLFQKVFLDFYKYFVYFKGFLISKLGITNGLLNMLAIIIAFLRFLFWIKIIPHCNISKVFYLLPKYIEIS